MERPAKLLQSSPWWYFYPGQQAPPGVYITHTLPHTLSPYHFLSLILFCFVLALLASLSVFMLSFSHPHYHPRREGARLAARWGCSSKLWQLVQQCLLSGVLGRACVCVCVSGKPWKFGIWWHRCGPQTKRFHRFFFSLKTDRRRISLLGRFVTPIVIQTQGLEISMLL